jgi:hypothetical protein
MHHIKSWAVSLFAQPANLLLGAVMLLILGWFALLETQQPHSSSDHHSLFSQTPAQNANSIGTSSHLQGSVSQTESGLDTSTTSVIGVVGGVLTTPDGGTTLSIPAGALAQETKVSLQRFRTTHQGVFALRYQLDPAMSRFQKPVDFRMTYTNQNVADAEVALIGGAHQSTLGEWTWLGKPSIDRSERTFVVTTHHASGSLCLAKTSQFMGGPQPCW